MLSIKIEKEIRQENKVLAGLTLRQLMSVLIGSAVCLVIWYVTRLSLDALIIPWAAVSVVCGAFGWISRDGMHLEDFLLRFMQRVVFRNGRLCYRTANRYVRMYNTGIRGILDLPEIRKERRERARNRRRRFRKGPKMREFR